MFHEDARVDATRIGTGTRIWQFAIVLAGAKIGRDCNICAHTFIENDVVLGNNVTVKCGVQLWDGVHVEDDVFIGPNVTFVNDMFPRSGAHEFKLARTLLKRGCSIGANATILGGLTIGEGAMIGAGSVVTKDVPAGETWAGNPARHHAAPYRSGFVASTGTPKGESIL